MLYKGAPPFSMSALYIIMNFNPRAPCGARQGQTVKLTTAGSVSIHAPHAGRDEVGAVY